MAEDLLTRWGRALDPEQVLPEYPRPQLVRDSYLNLNGWWEHAFTAADADAPQEYDGPILVPFSPEAPLSGVGRQLRPDELLWYRRTLTVPDGFVPDGGRLLLHFGAVDQTCTVWLNDVEVGANVGGYLPFTCDITDAVRAGENVLVLRVRDLSDGHQHASGKQRLHRGGIWYTAQSGIWQTVWLEAVPEVYVDRLHLVPNLDDASVTVTVHAASASGEAVVRIGDVEAAVPAGVPTTIALVDVHPWTPDDPFLHDVEVVLGEDLVTSYVGMRAFGVGVDARGTPRLMLNGAPYLHVGVLDQGYWPDGLLTAPSDEAMVHDIATMKRLGFNMLRKHLKVEPLRWYAHCDRLGMLVWQDLVNGGGGYRTAAVTWPGRLPGLLPIRLDDTRRRPWLGRGDDEGRAVFERELHRTVEHLADVVSLVVWVPFNEGWGQFDANRVAAELRAIDPTRLIDHASGWHDQGGGDLRSLHVYKRRFRMPRRRGGDRRVLALTEYGGHNLRVEGHVFDDEVDFGYHTERSVDELGAGFVRLHDKEVSPAVRAGLSATVYTQVSDVEDELNGLLTYDREVLKLPEALVRDVLGRIAP